MQATQATAKATDVGLIGLGIIGSRVAENLRKAGFRVWVWNRTPKQATCFLGSPAEVAAHADILQIFVKDGPALLDVIRKCGASLSPRHLVIGHATVSPDEARQAAELVEVRGAAYLDAPFTGSRVPAENGELVFYTGGSPGDLERARPVLEASAREILHFGEVGTASLLKLATNMVTASTVAAVAEALRMVEAGGVPGALFEKALEQNAVRSRAVDMKLSAMLQRDFTANFSLDNMHKDMRLVEGLLEREGLNREAVAAFLKKAERCRDRGLGGDDFSTIFQD